MSDAAGERAGARPSRAGTVNLTNLRKAEKRYKEWDQDAQTEFKRLFAIDKQTKLTSTANPYEHAVFVQLCILKEGIIHAF
jgi:spermidine synthase